jgi:hypothetical protein
MPRPAYLICSSSNAIDQQTNRASFFDVIDSLDVFPIPVPPTPPGFPAPSLMRAIAAWLRTDDDSPDAAYESQMACITPSGDDLFVTKPSEFVFKAPFHRIIVAHIPAIGFSSMGVYCVEARLRRVGESEWSLRQQFPFIVRQAEFEALSAKPEIDPTAG